MLWFRLATPTPVSDLALEVTQEADGGYVAECRTENIVTQATWEELRANVKEAVEGNVFDGPKPRSIRLHNWFAMKFCASDENTPRPQWTQACRPSVPLLGLK